MKFSFRKPRKEKILIYQESFLEYYLNGYKTEILPSINIKIYIYFVLISLFKNPLLIINLKKLRLAYSINFIKYINPKIMITFHDNDIFFYKLKNYFKNIKFISIQNGYRFKKNDLFGLNLKKKSLLCDYIFCFGNNIAKKYNHIFKSKIIIHGSTKNNLVKKKFQKKNWCLFISSYGLGRNDKEDLILPILEEYCKKNNLVLKILCRIQGQEEINYFSSFKFISNKNIIRNLGNKQFYNSYEILDKSKISISLNATLGYENLARGGRTLFINVKTRDLKCKSFLSFGWPKKYKNEGELWLNTIDKKKIFKRLNFILNSSNSKWNLLCKRYTKQIMHVDKKNKKLNSIIRNYL